MTTRDKLIELMKDPNSVQLGLDLAKHQDVELYNVAQWTFSAFSKVYHHASLNDKYPLDNLNNKVFSDIMKGVYYERLIFYDKEFMKLRQLVKGPAKMLGIKLSCMRHTMTNVGTLKANDPIVYEL